VPVEEGFLNGGAFGLAADAAFAAMLRDVDSSALRVFKCADFDGRVRLLASPELQAAPM
jgi:hypothetical protein